MPRLQAFKDFLYSSLVGTDVGHVFCQIILVIFVLSTLWLISIFRKRAFAPKPLLESLNQQDIEARSTEAVMLLNRTPERWHVLRNFTQGLIEITEAGEGTTYRRIQAASNLINPESFNPRLFKGYFLDWIPSVLTTMGVLGTFVGLQIGLGGIHLEGTVEEMLHGIRILIEGAKTAFSTSIFGVIAGIVFGFSLRVARQHQRNLLQGIAARIDSLIPETSPEDDLRLVRVSTAQASEQLKSLREEMGTRLQETLQGMPTLIGSAVAKEIQSTVGAIGQQNAEALGDALQDVYANHLGDLAGLGDTIRAQAELTNRILEKLNGLAPALETSASHLDASSKSLEAVSTEFSGWDEALKTYSTTLYSTADTFKNASLTLDSASKAVESTIPNLQQAIGNATKSTEVNQATINENSQSLMRSFGSITESFSGFEAAVGALKDIAPSLAGTGSRLNELVGSLEEASASQHENARNNRDAAERFGEAAGHFEKAASHLGTLGDVAGNLTRAGIAAQDGFEKLQGVTTQLQSLSTSLKSIAASFDQVRDEELGEQFTASANALNEASTRLVHLSNASENLSRASDEATRLFHQSGEEHLVFINGLTTGVAALKEEIASLLEMYRNSMAEQTQQRIQDWNNEATNFGIQFRQKVDDLSGAIEDLQESLATIKS